MSGMMKFLRRFATGMMASVLVKRKKSMAAALVFVAVFATGTIAYKNYLEDREYRRWQISAALKKAITDYVYCEHMKGNHSSGLELMRIFDPITFNESEHFQPQIDALEQKETQGTITDNERAELYRMGFRFGVTPISICQERYTANAESVPVTTFIPTNQQNEDAAVVVHHAKYWCWELTQKQIKQVAYSVSPELQIRILDHADKRQRLSWKFDAMPDNSGATGSAEHLKAIEAKVLNLVCKDEGLSRLPF